MHEVDVAAELNDGSLRLGAAVLASVAVQLSVLDPDGNIVFVNDAWRRFGESNEAPAEVINPIKMNYLHICGQAIGSRDDEYAARAVAGITAVIRGTKAEFKAEYPCHSPDQQRWFEMHVTRLLGAPGFVVVAHTDITARHLSELAAQAASRQFNEANRLLVMGEELAHVGHWRLDVGTNNVIWSDEVYRILGRSPEDGLPDLEVAVHCYHPDDRDRIAALVRTALSTGEGYTVELRIIRPDGEERAVRTIGQCERDPQGNIAGIFGVFQDVTELRDTERRLDIVSARLLLATHAGQVGISEIHYPGRKLYFDNVMALLYGLGADSSVLSDGDWWGAIYPDDVPLIEALLDSCERGAPSYELEYRVIWPNGDIRYIQSRGTLVVDAAGVPTKIVGTSWDVTEMRNLTAQLAVEKERAERASNAKSNFLAVMSHEIRTPMNGVMGMNALLLETGLTPTQRRMADAVHYSADALLTIIDDILDLSKLEAGRVDLEMIDFDLAEVMDKVAEIMVPKGAMKGLLFSIERTFAGSCWFRGDPTRLRQILLNLVSNAIKFTQSGGIVISASALPGDNQIYRLRFEVRDTGIGISEESKPLLFHPFEQVDATITRRFGGTGLGLSICKRLVEQMDGMIGVRDHPGGGSVFWFEIPMNVGSPGIGGQSGHKHRSATVVTGGSGHILLAEDNQVNIAVASMLLEAKGYTVEVARNGVEAVAAVGRGGFDLILMDMQMPVLDGLSATREIRGQGSYGRQVPIIAMTANAMKEDERRCLDAGMDDYLSKPINPHSLIALVERWLGRRGSKT